MIDWDESNCSSAFECHSKLDFELYDEIFNQREKP